MADAADDRDVAKSVRPVGPQAIPSRSGDAMRRECLLSAESGRSPNRDRAAGVDSTATLAAWFRGVRYLIRQRTFGP